MVVVCERWADGRATPGEVDRMLRVAVARLDSICPGHDDPVRKVKSDAAMSAMHLFDLVYDIAAGKDYDTCHGASFIALWVPEFTPLVRDIFANPFRPVSADPAWLTSTVVQLAAGIYTDRAFDRLPILADALQDAGCDNADLLDHCRGPGPHARGCWVVDLILGTE